MPDPDAPAPNGALIELSEAELDRLDLREMRYSRLDVTAAIGVGETGAEPPPFDRVVTYRPRPENHKPEPPDDAIIVANYLSTVEAAFDELGPGELDLFRATTAPPPVEVTEATLVRDRSRREIRGAGRRRRASGAGLVRLRAILAEVVVRAARGHRFMHAEDVPAGSVNHAPGGKPSMRAIPISSWIEAVVALHLDSARIEFVDRRFDVGDLG